MIEPLDDELRRLVGALREVERPGEAARAATWAAIDARIAEDPAPRRLAARTTWPLAALAAALVLALGLAAATAWREADRARVEAVDHHAPAPTMHPVEPRHTLESSQSIRGQSPQSMSGETPASPRSDVSPAAPESPRSDASPASLESARSESSPSGAPDPSESHAPGASPGLDGAVAPATPARPSASSRRRPADSPSLQPEEVASFQRAQAALAAGRYEEALDALDAHGRRFAGGLFEEERQVSRAAALCKLGRGDAAADARHRFLRERPGSHLAERMRQICRDDE